MKHFDDVDSVARAKPEESGEWSWVRIPPSALSCGIKSYIDKRETLTMKQ